MIASGRKEPSTAQLLGKVRMATPCLMTACTFVLKVLLLIYGAVHFILRDPAAFLGDDEVSVQGGSRTASGGFDQTCFPLSLAHN